MAIEVNFEGTANFIRALDGLIERVDLAGRAIVTKGGHAIERAAKQHMDGRPGPERQTGTLARSVRVVQVVRKGIGSWESSTGPTVIYGRRIELGFDAVDSLGRLYNQPPYPFLEPGLEDAIPTLVTIYRAEWGRVLRA